VSRSRNIIRFNKIESTLYNNKIEFVISEDYKEPRRRFFSNAYTNNIGETTDHCAIQYIIDC